jgi:uncharacterized spore protein YtfJ
MSLDRVFSVVEGMRQVACADVAFGKPLEVEGKVLIPVATVATGFGLGMGQMVDAECEQEPDGGDAESEEGQTPAEPGEQAGERPAGEGQGGGGGGGARSRPIAVIEVTPAATVIRPIVDESKVMLAGIALVAWIVLWLSLTLQAIFGREA